jgi:outer membrane protein TolC
VKNAEDLLKTILNLTPEEAESTKVIPTDTPKYDKVDVTLPDALVTAMKNRPDLETARIDVKNRKVTLDYQKNQLLPDLSLQASYWSPGVSGTQIIYDPNDPFGPPIGEIPGGAGQALRDVFGFKYQNWSVGLSLDIPINAIFARAAFAQAKVNLEQTLLRLQSQEQDIYLEIKTEVRAVQTNYKRVQAYKIARELQEKNLEAEEEKFKVGLTTNYFVLQYQRDLAEAQVAELSAVIDYNLSLANLSRALGTTLKEKNISLADFYGR